MVHRVGTLRNYPVLILLFGSPKHDNNHASASHVLVAAKKADKHTACPLQKLTTLFLLTHKELSSQINTHLLLHGCICHTGFHNPSHFSSP
jgi:hypothetical protein